VAQNAESNQFSCRDWKNVSSESFSQVCDEMLRKIKVPFNLLCDRAVLPQSEKNISVELTSYLAQIYYAMICAERSTFSLRSVHRKSQLQDWSKNRDLVNVCNSAKLWLSIWNDYGRPRDGLVNIFEAPYETEINQQIEKPEVNADPEKCNPY